MNEFSLCIFLCVIINNYAMQHLNFTTLDHDSYLAIGHNRESGTDPGFDSGINPGFEANHKCHTWYLLDYRYYLWTVSEQTLYKL